MYSPLTLAAGIIANVLREVDPELARPEQVEQPALQRVVGARRVSERRTDPPVALADELLARERFVW